jgi:GNAT superfamily N-acetyltransferase
VIRRARASDLESIFRLTQEGSVSAKNDLVVSRSMPSQYIKAFQKISQNEDHFLMVYEVDGTVAGTFHVVYLTYLAGNGREDCQVESVYVDQSFRSQGIGSRMMTWVINEAKLRNCRRVQLTSNKLRKKAHRFYERLGFLMSHEGAKLNLD